jgi:nondiscriminating glutamyl-tRNA synthetase
MGSVRTALFNWLFARSNKGTFILRIEDTDRARSADIYEKSILNDLRWLGLDWDEGPEVGGSFGPYYQSKRQDIYRKVAQKLLDEGKAYYCYCNPQELEESRKRALAEGRMVKYEGRCRELTKNQEEIFKREGRKPVIRFKVPRKKIVINDLISGQVEFDSSVIGDFILLRSDMTASFNFAVVVDDILMEITYVIRGNDHLSNTPRHILLFDALGHKLPQFAHHSLLLGTDHTKMSKRHGATAVFQYREMGYLPSALTNYLALLSWSPGDNREIFTPEELIKEFSIEGISKSPAIFDIDKLNWLNKQHILRTDPEVLARFAVPFLIEEAMYPKESNISDFSMLVEKIKVVQGNLSKLSEVASELEVLLSDSIEISDEAKMFLSGPSSKLVFESLVEILDGVDSLDENKSREILKALADKFKEQNIKGKNLYLPIRLALTGKASGPDLFYILNSLGKEKSLKRIEFALEKCNAL